MIKYSSECANKGHLLQGLVVFVSCARFGSNPFRYYGIRGILILCIIFLTLADKWLLLLVLRFNAVRFEVDTLYKSKKGW